MATHTVSRAGKAHSLPKKAAAPKAAQPSCHPEDRTDARLRAYLASVRILRGLAFEGEQLDALMHGRDLIERMAASASDSDEPSIVLTTGEAADVLSFVRYCEPVDKRGWHIGPDGSSHLVGFDLVLEAIELALRGGKTAEEDAKS